MQGRRNVVDDGDSRSGDGFGHPQCCVLGRWAQVDITTSG